MEQPIEETIPTDEKTEIRTDETPSPEKTEPEECASLSVNPPEATPEPDIDRLIAEAERRGYLRGRNEAIEESMTTPALWENTRLTAARALEQPDPASLFLSRVRPDVWD